MSRRGNLDSRDWTKGPADRHAPKVRRDFIEGVRSGVNGTPTFFINGERYEGPYTAEALLATIQGGAIPEIEPMSRLPLAGL